MKWGFNTKAFLPATLPSISIALAEELDIPVAIHTWAPVAPAAPT